MSGKRSRHLQLVLGLLVATLIASAAGSAAAVARSQNRIDEWVAERAEFVDAAVRDAVFGVIADLEGIAAYVEASDPGLQEFLDFVDQVNGTEAAVGVAYAAVVASEDIEDHVALMRDTLSPSYEISRMDVNGELEPIETDGRTNVYPVVRFAPGEAIKPFLQDVPIERLGIGLDGGFDPSWRSSIHDAVAAGSPFVSDFIELEFSGIPVAQVFFTSVPVLSDDGDVLGVVAAPMIEPLLLAGIDRRTLDGVEWEVMPTGSAPTRVDPAQATLIPLELPGTTWLLAVAPDPEMRTSLEGTPWWMFGIGAGLLALLGGVTFVLFVGGRSERRRADELRRVADDKDRFLATVSHELRTPLTAVAGVALELRDRPDDFDLLEHRSLLSLLVEQSDELASIVEDLLIAARSDIGKVVIHHGAVDLESEAHRAMETAGVAAEIIGSAKPAWADAQRVRQILRNLLSNAKRYGGSDVRVSFDTSPGYATVAVCDDGAPLPEEQRARIFDSYTSAHQPADAIESVGLGLFISRNLARAMGGDVEYHHDGRWSRFLLRLPLARDATGDGLDDPRSIPLGGRV